MQTLDKQEDKIAAICKTLKEETLEPARDEANRLVADARSEAERIVQEAREQAADLQERAKEGIKKERSVFESSLLQAGRQGLESLRQDIEEKLFSKELGNLVESESADPKLVARVIEALVAAVTKEGTRADLEAVVPRTVSSDEVAKALAGGIKEQLSGEGVAVGQFKGGARLKWLDRKLTLDISDEALKELLSHYVRKDFRKLLFGE